MATLDISIVNIALPTLSRTFGAPLTTVEWVVLAYVVTITGLLLVLGRLADRLGRRRVYGTGLVVFTLASALCAAAPGVGWLIAARGLQGLGAAMMTANSAALLISSFPPEERGRAIGAFGAMVGVGLALGPPLGGLIVGLLTWRWIFLVNLPIGALALWQLRTRVPADGPPRKDVRLGLESGAAWTCSLVCLMLALSRGPEHGWGSKGAWTLFGMTGLALAAFALLERRSQNPLLPVALLRGPLGATATLTLLGQALSIAVGFHLPLYFEEVLGFDAAKAGRWLAVLPVVALFMAPAAGRWSDRFGARGLSMAGLALAAAGFVMLSRLGLDPRPLQIVGGMAMVGAGLGLFTVPNSSALLSTVPASQLGIASGLQATMRNLGIAGGAAGAAALVASRYSRGRNSPLAAGGLDREALVGATHELFLALAVVAVAGMALAWARSPRRRLTAV